MFVQASCKSFKLFREKPKNCVLAMAITSPQRINALWKIKILSFPGMESRLAGSKPSHYTDWIIVRGWKKKKIGGECYKMNHKEEARYEMREKILFSVREPCNTYLFAECCHTSSMMDVV
jgi:hypothetical protein